MTEETPPRGSAAWEQMMIQRTIDAGHARRPTPEEQAEFDARREAATQRRWAEKRANRRRLQELERND